MNVTKHTQTKAVQKRWIVDYLQATDNEILFDINDYRVLNLAPETGGYLPRPTKWVGRIAPHFWFSKLAWRSALLFWQCGGAAAFHALQLLRALMNIWWSGGTAAPPVAHKQFALGFSTRAMAVINSRSVPHLEEACWIIFPWVKPEGLSPETQTLPAWSLLSARDMIVAFRHAVISSRVLARRKGTQRWQLHSYTAFRWFAVRAALEKLDGEFYMAEHYDRWAILTDSIVLDRRRRAGKTSKLAGLSLVQHGRVEGFSDDDAKVPQFHLTLKRRLHAVSALYVYDAVSERIFMESLLSARCVRRGVQVHHFRPQIVLQEMPGLLKDRVNILFVGHPACEALHVFLLQELKRQYPVNAFYKPHPLMQMSSELAGQDWQVITEKSHFPQVHFLVSYPSTLVVEYASSGIPAAVHPLDLAARDCQAFAAEVIAHIQRHA